VESIDIKAATEAGIKVINTPDAPTQGVAEFTIGLILSLLRKVPLMDRAMRNSLWKKEMGSLLNGKRIGIIGMGRIGRKVAELLGIFEVEISFFDVKEGIRLGKCKFMEKAKLCAWADIITLHCNAGSQGQKVIGRDELSWMKKGSWLVNVARGGLIDEAELVACLKNGKLSGAAIDVFENEPYKGPLLGLENVILTPHVGSYARESRIAMELEAAKNLLAGL
jgi:D-3-phosphoglycerate dehydrogenase